MRIAIKRSALCYLPFAENHFAAVLRRRFLD